MGHGLQMWLQIMWFLSFVNAEDIVILDEPDIYMHADLQRKIIKLLIEENFEQVIVATHSLEIISEVLPENILVVDRKRKVSKFTDSIPAVQKIIDNIGGVHNIQLTKLWKCKKCLIVEGKDLKILRHVHRTLFPTSENPLDIVPNMSIGGWGGWRYAIGSSMLLKNAADESIKTYCILDRDYYTKEQLLDVFVKAEENDVKLHIWQRKEIENYLIVPDAIYRIISAGTTSKKDINVKHVIEEINKICEEIKNDTFDAMANQIATVEKKDYHKANQKARSILNESWTSFEKKVSLVSGKIVISKLSKWSQDNYQVSFNSEKIASELQNYEISPEIKELLEAIERNKELNPPIKINFKEASYS
jgi:energy-coupling factor transporter ATP-binding protein EcfA2